MKSQTSAGAGGEKALRWRDGRGFDVVLLAFKRLARAVRQKLGNRFGASTQPRSSTAVKH